MSRPSPRRLGERLLDHLVCALQERGEAPSSPDVSEAAAIVVRAVRATLAGAEAVAAPTQLAVLDEEEWPATQASEAEERAAGAEAATTARVVSLADFAEDPRPLRVDERSSWYPADAENFLAWLRDSPGWMGSVVVAHDEEGWFVVDGCQRLRALHVVAGLLREHREHLRFFAALLNRKLGSDMERMDATHKGLVEDIDETLRDWGVWDSPAKTDALERALMRVQFTVTELGSSRDARRVKRFANVLDEFGDERKAFKGAQVEASQQI